MAVPKKKKSKSKTRSRRASAWKLRRAGPQPLPALRRRQAAAHRVPVVRLVQGPRRRRRRLSHRHRCSRRRRRDGRRPSTRRDPRRGASRAAEPASPSSSSARATSRAARCRRCLDLIEASEVIDMDDDPAQGVRRKKDSTLVRAAEAVRDGKASAMISAGNTGATMASALLRMGRIKGVKPSGDRHADPGARRHARPSCSTPAPTPRCRPSGSCSSPRWARSTPVTASASSRRGSACCRSARSPARATRCARRPTSCSAPRRHPTSSATSRVAT